MRVTRVSSVGAKRRACPTPRLGEISLWRAAVRWGRHRQLDFRTPLGNGTTAYPSCRRYPFRRVSPRHNEPFSARVPVPGVDSQRAHRKRLLAFWLSLAHQVQGCARCPAAVGTARLHLLAKYLLCPRPRLARILPPTDEILRRDRRGAPDGAAHVRRLLLQARVSTRVRLVLEMTGSVVKQ